MVCVNAAFCCVLFLFVCSRAAAEDEVPGVVVVHNERDLPEAVQSARRAGGADWRGETSRSPAERSAPARALEEVHNAYVEADFIRCMQMLQRPALDVDRLLENGARNAAAQLVIWASACAHAASDTNLAQELLERVFVRELPTNALSSTRPDFQAFAEAVRSRVLARQRARVTIRTSPASAALSIDGGSHTCERAPCTFLLLPGEHVFTASRMGRAPRAERRTITEPIELTLGLDPATAEDARGQLSRAMRGGRITRELANVSARLFDASVLVLVWRSGLRTQALLYDRESDRFAAHATVDGESSSARAVQRVISEWRSAEATPLYVKPLFYVTIAGVAAAAAVTVYLLARPEDETHDLVFP